MFDEYEIVKLVSDDVSRMNLNDGMSLRQPTMGDIATILLVFKTPPAYELECLGADGNTQWVATVPHEFVSTIVSKE